MHTQYERLFSQLNQLLQDEEVQQNLDQKLKARASKLIQGKGKSFLQNKKEPFTTKEQKKRLLQKKIGEDMSHTFQKIVLRESCSKNKLSGKISNDGYNIKSSKRSESKYRQKSRQRLSSKQSKVLAQKSSYRNTKQTSKNLSHVSSASKIKQRCSSKQALASMRQPDRDPRERSNSKVKGNNNNKENVKIHHTKPSKKISYQKTESDSDHSSIVFSKNKTNSNRKGREVMRNMAGESEPSTFSISNSKKASLSLQKQKKILQTIQQKKQEITQEKLVLQDSIKMLQDKINKERSYLYHSESRIVKIKHQMNRIQNSQKQKSIEGRVSRKKSQSFLVQAKQIQSKIYQANRSNQTILDTISEEKYLIQMYRKVIEQMKSQLRVEKEDKVCLKKKLSLLKNNEKMIAQKCNSKQALSDQLFSSMKQILKIWD